MKTVIKIVLPMNASVSRHAPTSVYTVDVVVEVDSTQSPHSRDNSPRETSSTQHETCRLNGVSGVPIRLAFDHDILVIFWFVVHNY
jgi:hypothetical protein